MGDTDASPAFRDYSGTRKFLLRISTPYASLLEDGGGPETHREPQQNPGRVRSRVGEAGENSNINTPMFFCAAHMTAEKRA